MAATRKIGSETDAQRARKIAKAEKMIADAAAIFDGMFTDMGTESFRMTFEETQRWAQIGRAAGAAEEAARAAKAIG